MSRRGRRVRGEESRGTRAASAAEGKGRAQGASLGSLTDALGNQAVGAALMDRAEPGRPLEPSTRRDMESHFDADLGDVRVHTGPAAHSTTRDLSARAFTHGADIAFGAGEYQPESLPGRGLLAHELAHVLQQRHASSGDVASATAGALEGQAHAVSQAVQRGEAAPSIAAPAGAPAVQCWGITDYLPDFSGAVEDVSRRVFDTLGHLDESSIARGIEWALANPIAGPLIRNHPLFAADQAALDLIASTPGVLEGIWTFIKDPRAQIDRLEEFLHPHIWSGVQCARTHGEELLRGFGVPESHGRFAGKALEVAASVAGQAAEFVIDDVIVDTVAFYKLRSEREAYNEAKQKYDVGLIDTHDFVVEHIAFVLSVLGRLEDMGSVVLWLGGLMGGGAAGGAGGTVVPGAGNVAGAGGGGAAGSAAGVTVAEIYGLVVSLGPAALELEKIAKAGGDLLLADQTDEQRGQDYQQIGASAVSLAVMAAMAFLPGLALRAGKRLGRRIIEMMPSLASLIPRAAHLLEEAAEAAPTPRAGSARGGGTEGPRVSPAPTAATPAVRGAATEAAPAIGGAPNVDAAQPSVRPTTPSEGPTSVATDAASRAPPPPPAVTPRPAASGEPPLPDNVRQVPAERARPPGQGELDTPGEVVPLRSRAPEGPEPPEPRAARAEVPAEEQLLRTGTDDVPYTPPAAGGPTGEAPRAMADTPGGGGGPTPPTPATPGGATSTPGARSPRQGGGGGRPPRAPSGGGGGGGAGGGGRRGGGRRNPPAPVQSAREQIRTILGRLNAPAAAIDQIDANQARAILRAPVPPESDVRARDIYRYLKYRYRGRGAKRVRRGEEALTYREWSRRAGLLQQQRARRRGDTADVGSNRFGAEPAAEPRSPEPSEELEGPSTDAGALEDAGRVADTSSSTDRTYQSLAGQAMERGPVRQRLEQIFGAAFRILPKRQFPPWLRQAYRREGVEGPDFIIESGRRISIIDSVPGPRAEHLDKTLRDVNIASGAAPRGTFVDGREYWWSHTETPEDRLPPSEIARMRQEFAEEFGDQPVDPESFRMEDEGFDEALDLPQFSRRILPSLER